jgi:LysR family transcriptional activator of nhaA
MAQPVHAICREGELEAPLGQLAAHRLDLVRADEPASNGTKVRTFNHPLGESSTSFCACGGLAAAPEKGFPQSSGSWPFQVMSHALSSHF